MNRIFNYAQFSELGFKVKQLFASYLGSARASRADCGASPQSIPLNAARQRRSAKKFAMAEAPSPAREARALPRRCRRLLRLGIAFHVATFAACETSNYIPPVTSTMTGTGSRAKQSANSATLERGRTLFVHRCIECHTLPPMWKYSREDWPQIVSDMSHRASLKPQEREAVIAYILAVRKNER
jgi:mono/diheme cytochrome c family protein